MKIKLIKRMLLGAPLGLTIGVVIAAVISACIGDGGFHLAGQEQIDAYGNEFNAAVLQFAFCALYGAMWAGASVIWETEWSMLLQTLAHLAVVSVSTFPVAYFTGWMEHSLMGIIGYYGMFFATYAVVWLSMYIPMKRRIAQMNEKLKEVSE